MPPKKNETNFGASGLIKIKVLQSMLARGPPNHQKNTYTSEHLQNGWRAGAPETSVKISESSFAFVSLLKLTRF